ncbi:MAG: TetM/TetW/TetO/TetS family tetracycline resistance ribosomal protection protein, partial [Oscillospiraceae bacterium]|nr:TetM/TetW/TetO/TetS family tetracycline resistance ribosomal protection protein [Oscillospiraceae bacterium]
QLRLYSGVKFTPLDVALSGTVCAVTGLSKTYPGQGLGTEPDSPGATLEPVLNYRVQFPDGTDIHTALQKLRELEEEDPQLHILWNEHLRELHIQLMGPVQTEILTRRIRERFGMEVSFGEGNIVYRETIAAPVIGVGHFEPLRHYAEVLLLLEPGERGSGLVFRSGVSENQLDLNWQRLILTHMAEKTHLGVLTGSPITDLSITLIAGKAHLKHTEGGDFRQATYRAIRQGLRQAESILLEPWYNFRLDLPSENVGRAMSDIQQRSGSFDAPELMGDRAVLKGSAPVSAMKDYAAEVVAYTRGRGQLVLQLKGYFPCHNAKEVMEQISYDVDGDTENTADSVFCSHGAGHTVKWNEVPDHQHLTSPVSLHPESVEEPVPSARKRSSYADAVAQDKELQAIFEQTYGPVKQKRAFDSPRKEAKLADKVTIKEQARPEEYLLVDGYNIIFAWDYLKEQAKISLDSARQTLMEELCSYQAHKQCHVILVFDAYKVQGGKRHVEQYHNIHVVYTQEAETADQYIEQASYKLGKHYRVRVATSDGMEQIIVLGHGCLRVSAKIFREEMDLVKAEISRMIREHNQKQ